MTIARRLTLLLAVPILVLMGLGGFIAYQLSGIHKQSRFVSEMQIESLTALGSISRKITDMRVSLRNLFIAESAAEQARPAASIRSDREELTRLLAEYGDKLISDEPDRRLYTEFRELSTEWAREADKLVVLSEGGRQKEARAALLTGYMPQLGDRLDRVLANWINHNQGLAKDAGEGAVRAIDESERQLLTATLIAVLLSGILGYITLRKIVHPIRGLQASVKSIADGNYPEAVPYTKSAGETGDLARSIAVLKDGAAQTADQRWIKANVAKITSTLQRTESLSDFGGRLLPALVPLLGGGVAAFYVMEKDQVGELNYRGIHQAKIVINPDVNGISMNAGIEQDVWFFCQPNIHIHRHTERWTERWHAPTSLFRKQFADFFFGCQAEMLEVNMLASCLRSTLQSAASTAIA
jgi:CHASE3 domain sensor protein